MADNLVTTSPSRFSVIQPNLLGQMQVLQNIDTEAIIAARMSQFKTLWASYDPPNAAQYDVGALEFDPIKIQAELSAYFELMLRNRVNQAARAVTLAYAVGTDLDAIASRYPYGLPRLAGETDDQYRTRIWLSPSILSLNGPGQGTFESYVFWALSAPMPPGEASLKHASALTVPGTGRVIIVILPISNDVTTLAWVTPPDNQNMFVLTTNINPIPDAAQISAVYQYVSDPTMARQGLTDIVSVVSAKVTYVDAVVQFWLFPGVDGPTLIAEVCAAVAALIQAIGWLGADLTLLSIQGAMAQAGVYNTKIVSPQVDQTVGMDGCVCVRSFTLIYMGTGE